MPNDSDHITSALHDIEVAGYLLKRQDFSDWATVAIFYAAMHIVEAVLFCDPKAPRKHGITHQQRNDILKGTRHYENIYRHYSIIYRAALIARYLEDSNTGKRILFQEYLPVEKVQNELIQGRFGQVVKSAANFLPSKFSGLLDEKFKDVFAVAED